MKKMLSIFYLLLSSLFVKIPDISRDNLENIWVTHLVNGVGDAHIAINSSGRGKSTR